jgi:hypothetical protein
MIRLLLFHIALHPIHYSFVSNLYNVFGLRDAKTHIPSLLPPFLIVGPIQ